MVDVGHKPPLRRRGVARAPSDGPRDGRRLRDLPKGDALTTRSSPGSWRPRRRAPDPALPSAAALARRGRARGGEGRVEITASAETTAQTGVEMEALTAVAVAGADRLRHGEGDRQGDDDQRDRARRQDEGGRLRAAVLTVSDRVSAARPRTSAATARVAPARRRLRGIRRLVADEATEIAHAIVDLAAEDALVLTTGGTGSRGTRRHPRGHAVGARARGARDPRGDPRRLDREDAARDAFARRRRHGRDALVVNLAGSPGPAGTATRCCGPPSPMRSAARGPGTATDHVHT